MKACEPMSKIPYGLRDAGAHWHDNSPENKMILGDHKHLLDDMETILQRGDHSHDRVKNAAPGAEGQIDWSGEHVHEILLPNGKRAITQPVLEPVKPGEGATEINMAGGRHKHEVLPDGEAGNSGQHTHTIKMPDGTTKKTLSHDQIKILVEKGLFPNEWDGMI